MTKVADLIALEARLKAERGFNRAMFGQALGITQNRLRRHLANPEDQSVGRTLGLAMAAVAAELEPYSAS